MKSSDWLRRESTARRTLYERLFARKLDIPNVTFAIEKMRLSPSSTISYGPRCLRTNAQLRRGGPRANPCGSKKALQKKLHFFKVIVGDFNASLVAEERLRSNL
uniref:Uncharacterized protein n=1 Tax=Haemonchus contortus TaxID=6289 RepID=A0A7I4XZJ5_HAECO